MKQGIHPKTVSKHFSYKDMFITLNRYSHVFPRIQGGAVKICSERPFE
ncbi:integrase [Bacillus cereus]|uniref:Integrase n=1 Tax=Bacillus cereus TaxID=1396 RepID=A0A9X7GQX7_BACCE|nr:integrase [Bacillus cereus]QFQ26269.1 integrase [Bacillus thuringiensis]RKN60423.1 integrase [Bacillus sp. S66]KXY95484.1 integrase [Bacillus cereus]MBR9669698.1 integrase [Bacillus cereus]